MRAVSAPTRVVMCLPRRDRRRCIIQLAGLLTLGGLAGCRSSGTVQLTSLDFQNIDPPPPRVGEIPLDACYWWTGDDGRVWVAMERTQAILFGRQRFTFQLSLVLDRMPAGRGRNYRVARKELRGVLRLGPAEGRYRSIDGVVALYRENDDRLRGGFRMQVRQETLVLLGWSKPRRYLMLGTFDAVHDPARGREIAEQTEGEGWERESPASQPASQPAETPSTD